MSCLIRQLPEKHGPSLNTQSCFAWMNSSLLTLNWLSIFSHCSCCFDVVGQSPLSLGVIFLIHSSWKVLYSCQLLLNTSWSALKPTSHPCGQFFAACMLLLCFKKCNQQKNHSTFYTIEKTATCKIYRMGLFLPAKNQFTPVYHYMHANIYFEKHFKKLRITSRSRVQHF